MDSTTHTLYVISDLHISAGPLDDFDSELDGCFAKFVESIAPGPTELVINGDFLDFVQAPPWSGEQLSSQTRTGIPLSFTEQQSLEKLNAIIQAHPVVFQSLSEFLRCNSINRLVILPGNHDADLFWPSVQRQLGAIVSGINPKDTSRFKIHLSDSYSPPSYKSLRIEHGHQYDPCNCFVVGGKPCWSTDAPPIFLDASGTERLYECVGTRFLVRYLNELDRSYPFVDNVKPLSRFLQIFGASALMPGFAPLKASVAIWGFMTFVGQTLFNSPVDLLSIPSTPNGNVLNAWAMSLKPTSRAEIHERLEAHGYSIHASLELHTSDPATSRDLLTFLAEHPNLLDGVSGYDFDDTALSTLSLNEGGPFLKLGGGFSVDETRNLFLVGKDYVDNEVASTVVMGHTHEDLDRRDVGYVNTGCWTRYYRFQKNEPLRRWSLLRSVNNYTAFPFCLRASVVRPDANGKVELITVSERKNV